MSDLETRIRTRLSELRDASIVAAGDLTAMPARAERHRRARRRRSILAGGAALVAAVALVAVVVARDHQPGSDATVLAEDRPGPGVAFRRVAGIPGAAASHSLRLFTSGDDVVALGQLEDGRPALWRSTDGETWSHEELPDIDGGDMFAGYLRADGWEVVWGDDTGPGPGQGRARLATAWTRPEGGPWRVARLPEGDGPDSGPAAAFLSSTGLVLVGHQAHAEAALVDADVVPSLYAWTTEDGASWAATEIDLEGLDRGAIVSWIGGFDGGVLLELGHRTDDPGSELAASSHWVSTNGRTWQRVDPTGLGNGADLDAVASTDDDLVAIGSRSGAPAAWRSTDAGHTWRPVGIDWVEPAALLQPQVATRGSDVVFVAASASDHVHTDASGQELMTRHHRVQLARSTPDGTHFATQDLSADLHLDPHTSPASIHLVGDRMLLVLTAFPVGLGQPLATELWVAERPG